MKFFSDGAYNDTDIACINNSWDEIIKIIQNQFSLIKEQLPLHKHMYLYKLDKKLKHNRLLINYIGNKRLTYFEYQNHFSTFAYGYIKRDSQCIEYIPSSTGIIHISEVSCKTPEFFNLPCLCVSIDTSNNLVFNLHYPLKCKRSKYNNF